MNILVIGEKMEKRELWGSLLSNSLPSSTVITNQNLFSEKAPPSCNIIICLTAQLDLSIQVYIERCINNKIPVLCVADDIDEKTYNELRLLGIKGILNGRMASLDTLHKAIRIVMKGGIYAEPPGTNVSNKRFATSFEKPMLDIKEWGVFSLTSKGFTVDEISSQLHITIDETLKYQTQIIEKTKSKTMPGAVVNGINQGWLLDYE